MTDGPNPFATLDAEALLDATARELNALVADARIGDIEIYRRSSIGLRLETRGGSLLRDVGREDGTAVRLRPSGGTRVHSAASTGAGTSVTERCVGDALSWPGDDPGTAPWTPEIAAELIDRDSGARLPAPVEAAAWLDQAIERLGATGVTRLERAWLHVAWTVETWVGASGLRASRSRARTWAVAELDPATSGFDAASPLVIAARGLGRLPRDGWARRAAARHLPAASPLRPAPAPRSVVFAAEPAAALVDLLVRALHAPGARLPGDWGRGWRVVDDPTIEGALFGGGFDDAGFACAPVELAGDGQIGSLPATGRLRRPSFRDPPRPHAAHVVVRPGEVEPPAGGVLVTGFDTHRLAGERVALVLRGALVEDGRPVVPLAGAVLRTSPHELVARCVGGIGAVASSHLGIDTPALRFDGVEVEPFP